MDTGVKRAEGYRKWHIYSEEPKKRDIRCTKPGDVLVVPRHGLPAASLQGASARHPPEGVDVGPGVEVGPPQETHSSKALFRWVATANGV